jgi:hypothetical protein
MALKVKTNSDSKPETKADPKSAASPQTVRPALPPLAALSHESSQTRMEMDHLIGNFDPKNLLQGIVMAEILGKPRSRGRRS